MLKHLGFEVITASDGVEVLEAFPEHQDYVLDLRDKPHQ
jgi:hypothetical protein